VRWPVLVCLAVLAVASAPRSVAAVPPECRIERDLPSSSSTRRTRRLLRALIPTVYVRWRGWGTGTGERRGRHPIGTPRRSSHTEHRRSRRNRWVFGMRWRPFATRAPSRIDEGKKERREMPVDPALCRRLSRLRRDLSSDAEPETRTILREAILERHIEAIRNHE